MAKRWQTKATTTSQKFGSSQGPLAETYNDHQGEAGDPSQRRDHLLSVPNRQVVDQPRLPHMRRQKWMAARNQIYADADRQGAKMESPEDQGRHQQEQCQTPTDYDEQSPTHCT